MLLFARADKGAGSAAGGAPGVRLVAGAVAASADSLPDSALYPLKGVVENVRGALAFSPADKVRFHLDIARTRLIEAQAMIARHRLAPPAHPAGRLHEPP